MINIILSYMRNKKTTIIFIFLLLCINSMFSFFYGILLYNNYLINDIYGNLEENKGYIIETTDTKVIKSIKNKFSLNKIEKNYGNDSIKNYYIVLDNYKDTDSFLKYINSKNIECRLSNTEKTYELDLIKENSHIYSIIFIIIIFILITMLYFTFRYIILSKQKDVLLLNALGFNNFSKFLILLSYNLILIIGSLLILIFILNIVKFNTLIIKNNNLKAFLKNISLIKLIILNIYIISFTLIMSLITFFKFKKHDNFKLINE